MVKTPYCLCVSTKTPTSVLCVSRPYSDSSRSMSPALLAVVFVSVSLVTSPAVSGSKILVFPLDGSHWLNMNLLIRGLHARGHEVTVVRSPVSWYIAEQASHYRSITITQAETHLVDQDFYNTLVARMLALQRQQGSLAAIMNFYWEMGGFFGTDTWRMVERIFENKTLMQNLHSTQFDLVLIDPGVAVGVLVAHELKLPTVYNVRWITGGEGHFWVVVLGSSFEFLPPAARCGHLAHACRLCLWIPSTHHAKCGLHWWLSVQAIRVSAIRTGGVCSKLRGAWRHCHVSW